MNLSHEELMKQNYNRSQPGADSRLMDSQRKVHPKFFVDATWLAEHLDEVVVVEVTRDDAAYQLDQVRTRKHYLEGHIPGAIHLSTDELGEFKGYFPSAEAMAKVFEQKGIRYDTPVVFYSFYARDIMYIASRMALAAYYLGVESVYLLDGGWQAWERADYPIEVGEVTLPQVVFGRSVPKYPELLVQTPEEVVQLCQAEPEAKLVSVRSWNEYIGSNQGHAWNKGVGEIKGALYGGDDFLTNEQGYVANPKEYQPSWEAWGIEPEDNLILYCGTSWRASTCFFIMKELGYQHLRLYDGSWYQWYLAHEADPERFPIQQGDPR